MPAFVDRSLVVSIAWASGGGSWGMAIVRKEQDKGVFMKAQFYYFVVDLGHAFIHFKNHLLHSFLMGRYPCGHAGSALNRIIRSLHR